MTSEQQNKKQRYDIAFAYIGTLVVMAGLFIKLTTNEPTFNSEHNHLELERGQAAMTQSIKDMKVNIAYIRRKVDKIK